MPPPLEKLDPSNLQDSGVNVSESVLEQLACYLVERFLDVLALHGRSLLVGDSVVLAEPIFDLLERCLFKVVTHIRLPFYRSLCLPCFRRQRTGSGQDP